MNSEIIKQKLESLGDSLVVSENQNYMRVHIHTNYPNKVVEMFYKEGQILETKADDMKAQKRLSQKHSGEIALVIDSIADIPQEILPDFVYQIPLQLLADGVSYQDKRTVFSDLFQYTKVTSSQLNQKQVEDFLHPIVRKYNKVLILSVSSKMSGLYERYEEAVNRFPGKLVLIDTKRNSVAEGLLVHSTIEWIKEKKNISEIQKELEKKIERTQIYVSLKNIKAMISSGRINEKIGWLFQKIGFLPLITINQKGEGTIYGAAFSKRQNERLFYQKIEKEKRKIENYAIVHANDLERAKEVEEKLVAIIGKPPLYVEEISSVVQLFSGTGSIAIGYVTKEESE